MTNAHVFDCQDAELSALYNHLHEHPETSWNEFETTAFLTRELEKLGLRVQTYADITGVIGEWGPSTGPVIAIRSDIDALWQEVDGVWRANHSCGHDAHMTIALGVVKQLRNLYPTPSVRFRVLFQPAEEKGNGALRFVERGAVEDVQYLFGVHVRPIQELPVGKMAAAIRHGASAQLDGHIQGCEAHAARPHLGINSIEVASAIVQSIQSIHLDPTIPFSAKMTRLNAGGESGNIIPGSAVFTLDLRAQTNTAMDDLVAMVEQRIQRAAQSFGAEVNYRRSGRTMAAEVNQDARTILAESITDVLGDAALAPDIVTPGAEDFHYYTALRPEIKATMLGLGCGVTPGLHHPKMTFDRTKIMDGVRILTNAVDRARRQLEDM